MFSIIKSHQVRIFLILITLLATSCTEDQAEEFSPKPEAQKTLKIMALGNSITQGSAENPSYRYQLWRMLVDAELNFEYVGSLDTNWDRAAAGTEHGADVASPAMGEVYKGKTFNNKHEGHWGWTLQETLYGKKNPTPYKRDKGKLSEWLQGYTPDVVLMHLGTNDLIHSQPLDSTISKVERVVNQLRADNDGVAIFMAKVTPIPAQFANVDSSKQYNNLIPKLASRLSTSRSPIIVVDMYTGFNPDTHTYDALHPNSEGEKLIAKRWFDAIMANKEKL
ncbi:hypothetical protein H9Q13_05525 [Pontibacter sp. JH31]|uniref:SGNH hydrolase-type esterase domain-containing protein n=1 Tax=Pontibacter aquaedesilientis TaxID=2766980 RepID=A0ABR7XEA4_9BACT|nr:SGNH/GDSL hydrolase family protein [Pontibacter aquaedesilientis]MBD1396619.1 hypothetical protein [Pontibacter aquaedesilientis]